MSLRESFDDGFITKHEYYKLVAREINDVMPIYETLHEGEDSWPYLHGMIFGASIVLEEKFGVVYEYVMNKEVAIGLL